MCFLGVLLLALLYFWLSHYLQAINYPWPYLQQINIPKSKENEHNVTENVIITTNVTPHIHSTYKQIYERVCILA